MYPNVIIKSPDTDVFLIALNASSNIRAQIFFETGNQNKRRIISLEKVKQHVGAQWCSAFIGFHSFTGIFKINVFYWLDPITDQTYADRLHVFTNSNAFL